MRRVVILLFLSMLVFAQPQQSPVEAAISAYSTAHGAGRFTEASQKLDDARHLLDTLKPETPDFGFASIRVAQVFDGLAMTVQARAILESALSRLESLGAAHPAHIGLLSTLADSWEADRNLLKALDYRERAVAASDALGNRPPPARSPFFGQQVTVSRLGDWSNSGRFSRGYGEQASQQLADLYRRLGRPAAATAVIARMASRMQNDPVQLASLYVRDRQLDQAEAVLRKTLEQSPTPATLMSLAGIYQLDQKYGEAAATLRQAITAVSGSGKPEDLGQLPGLRQQLAMVLDQAGQTEASDQVHQQIIADSPQSNRASAIAAYADHLSRTQRVAEGTQMIEDYLASRPHLESWEEQNLLNNLANFAQRSGDQKRAEEYRLRAAKITTQPSPFSNGRTNSEMQAAQKAAASGKVDEALTLALTAIDHAENSPDRDQVAWQTSNLALVFASHKASDAGQRLFQRALAVLSVWSGESRQVLLDTWQNYARFLMRTEFDNQAAEAIDQYREALIAARGAETGWRANAIQLQIEWARQRGSRERALAAGQELLKAEESLSGKTSEPYFRSLQSVADIFDFARDPASALELRREAVSIADLCLVASNLERGQVRMRVAESLAHLGRFDEAERLIAEANAIANAAHPPQPAYFRPQIEQILRMKADAMRATVK